MTDDTHDLMTLVDEIKAHILGEFLGGEGADELDAATPLITGGILDSISTVRLVGFLEERYGVQFAAHEMDVDHLDNLDLIAKTVISKRS